MGKLKNLYRIKYPNGFGGEKEYIVSGMIFTDKDLAADYARGLDEKDFEIETLQPEPCGGYWVPGIFN